MADSAMLCKDGRVVGVEDGHVNVMITTPSACSTCHAKSVCSTFEQKEKVITAQCHEELKVGDTVRIEMEEKLGWIALLYSFLLPFFLMIFILFGLIAFGASQTLSALISIVSLVPYYLLLYRFRNKIEKDFVFLAVKKD